ncbi:transcriptional regulator [Longispora fulva]|uniref:DNA-binding CsgD family transcriptional regulator/sugar-specific transcriptional regulator TrmB n=1 Tax=Longispora fulva TaxID=619741 RepID=A0A8J7GBB3_9ACTN|nr:helix-turn-helix transcriptional regulator [Longispora fulva]MBG6134276.1 DNA-binding CsgD family transcriptional regulator/sugar-specific transcriptional regulator TrmB [Longispora fulva]GIG62991.1 transcriptional regulator [Longispora fulva]
MLEILGLSDPTARVYQAMLSHPGRGVAVLAEVAELTEAQVRAALNELADLELLRPQLDGTQRPVSPEIGLTALLAAAESEVADKQRQIEATRAAIAAIATEHEAHRAQSSDSAIRLEGLVAVRARLEELSVLAREECLSLNPGGAHRPDARSASAPLNQQALERGVRIQTVCRDSFRNDLATLAYARWLTNLGGQMRTVPTVPMPLIIIDRRIAVLPIDPVDPTIGALEVTSPGILAASCALFDHLWSTGTPFATAVTTDEQGLTPQERTLLELADAGHTDESAARKLGVSARTVKRAMAELMERLRATSRFQAGANAARRGWI